MTRRNYRWDETYDAEGYLRVLNTYSGHRSLNDAPASASSVASPTLSTDRFDGRIVKGYLTTLYVAHRR